nr:MAG: capsid protein [Avian astrovirus 7]
MHSLKILNFRKFQEIFIRPSGREDRIKMMGDQPKPQRPPRQRRKKKDQTVNVNVKVDKQSKPKKKQVVQTVIHETKGGQRPVSMRLLRRELNRIKKRERKLEGPKTDNVMLTTMTIGTVDGTTTSEGLMRKHKVLLNPLLLKPSDADATPSPITFRASQYSLYKINKLTVKIMPLVGKAVVAGSLALFDIQQTGAVATPDNLDDIKARTHSEVALGFSKLWRVPSKDLVGPRDGWWYVDTNDDPTQSLGPALNVWLYGKTSNLFSQNTEKPDNFYPGPLFLVEMRAQYAFANYTPKPGLATLKKGAWKPEKGDVKIVADSAGNLQLEVKNAPGYFIRSEPRAAGELGEIMWAVAGAAVDGISTAFPQWGWLIRAGWFVVRRIFGQTRTGPVRYKIYASAEDAAKDFAVRSTGYENEELPLIGDLQITQLNNPNLNAQTVEQPLMSAGVITHDYVPTGAESAPGAASLAN